MARKLSLSGNNVETTNEVRTIIKNGRRHGAIALSPTNTVPERSSRTSPVKMNIARQHSGSCDDKKTCTSLVDAQADEDYRVASQRRIRLLPTINSISSRSTLTTSFAPILSPIKPGDNGTRRTRGSPARTVKKQLNYRDISPSGSLSESQSEELSIFCDSVDDSTASSFSDSDVADSPTVWPSAKIQAASPTKKGDRRRQQTASPSKAASPSAARSIARSSKEIDGLLSGLQLSDQENRAPPPTRPTFAPQLLILARPTTPPSPFKTPPASPSKPGRLLSPSKSRLNSPSKRAATRIPTPPGRQSLDDAFWDAAEVNTWNVLHSPRKPILSPSKPRFYLPGTLGLNAAEPDSTPATPSSPAKKNGPILSPRKGDPLLHSPRKTKAEVAARKAFDEGKDATARAFLVELDERITGGAIAEATKPTGGVKVEWSRTLNSTAGRAHWRRETVRVTPSSRERTPEEEEEEAGCQSPTKPTTEVVIRHHTKIELAAKVLTDEIRLLNTLAHEFCHLATYIVSGVKTNPHGKEFKAWGKKCSVAFGGRGIEVTTKHGYEIEWRYVWVCAGKDPGRSAESSGEVVEIGDDAVGAQMVFEGGCGATIGRHSKSVDPSKSRCARCKGRLVQIKPVPKAGAKESSSRSGDQAQEEPSRTKTVRKKVDGFAGFVKREFAAARKEMEVAAVHGKVSHRAVMEELGRRWRVEKEKKAAAPGQSQQDEELAKAMEVVVIED